MATVVFVHAHPDDESTLTSGSMARASAEGHRVVTVIATNGEHGEAPEDLGPDETVADRRRREAEASASALGVARLAWLGYADSGMTGWDQNRHEASFHAADLDEAAGRLAALLDEELADVVVGYDWHGNYGHPDHVKVHHVVRRAVDLVGGPRPRLLEATMNRDRLTGRGRRAAGTAAGGQLGCRRADGRREPTGHARGGDSLGGRRHGIPRPAARVDDRACQPGDRHAQVARARTGRLRPGLLDGVLHRARADRTACAGVGSSTSSCAAGASAAPSP